MRNTTRGFTLVELMIVIAIIGILAMIMPTISKMYLDRAKQAQTRINIRNLQSVIEEARISTDKTLIQIIPYRFGCTECQCKPPPLWSYTGKITEVSDAHSCYIWWKGAVDAIFLAAWHDLTEATKYYRDSWNAPYLLDENEGQSLYNPLWTDSCDRIMSSFGILYYGSGWMYTYKFPRLDWAICP
jgi:prepilin-type N-terminal cleavage/methylation domain-containing protein